MPAFLSTKSIALSSALLAILGPNIAAAQENNVNCPGVLTNNDEGSYCCVGGSLTLSVCAGWPICTGPTTIDTATQTESCVTKVPLTQSDYSSVINSYASANGISYGSGSGNDATTTESSSGSESTAEASTTAEDSTMATTTSAGDSSSASAADASSSSASSSSSAGAADRVVGPVGAIAGGLLGLAALL